MAEQIQKYRSRHTEDVDGGITDVADLHFLDASLASGVGYVLKSSRIVAVFILA